MLTRRCVVPSWTQKLDRELDLGAPSLGLSGEIVNYM